MRILVTGGAGCIGSPGVDQCIEEGYPLAVVDNLVTGKMENRNPRARFYPLAFEEPAIEEIFSREKLQVVIHEAAQVDVRKSGSDPLLDARLRGHDGR